MTCRSSFPRILMALLPAVGFLATAPASSAAPPGQLFLQPGESVESGRVIEIRKRGRGPRLTVPIAPSYLYYDYPYYYSRGFYPTHIGPGFVYYGYPYSTYTHGRLSKDGGPCSDLRRRCAADRGHHRHPRR